MFDKPTILGCSDDPGGDRALRKAQICRLRENAVDLMKF